MSNAENVSEKFVQGIGGKVSSIIQVPGHEMKQGRLLKPEQGSWDDVVYSH